jgi:hypothetical protein
MATKSISFRCKLPIAPNATFFVTFHFPEHLDFDVMETELRSSQIKLEEAVRFGVDDDGFYSN